MRTIETGIGLNGATCHPDLALDRLRSAWILRTTGYTVFAEMEQWYANRASRLRANWAA